MKLEGKVALITGASGSIGSAVAKRFIKEGAQIILITRSIANLNALYDEIKEFKEDSVTLIQLDLLDFEGMKQLADRIKNLKLSGSALDILVACAEVLGESKPIQDGELKQFQNVINTNLVANWYLLKNLHPILGQSNSGRVIFLTSKMTLFPDSFPYWGTYIASKAAIEMIVKVYATEAKHTRLCVNAIYHDHHLNQDVSLPHELTDRFVDLASENCTKSGEVLPLINSDS